MQAQRLVAVRNCTEFDREIENQQIETILRLASDSPRKIETHLLGFCRPCQCVLPLYRAERIGRDWSWRAGIMTHRQRK